ncbi:MotA/TolQ/ExbB proton channel family protein [Guptibacillus hwajinpoensis]|uniref:MotA/TolQ/ExbB proton channel family protein n=1 Tax=Guptibacillus hwajinpoensis TaxID=208199 RepID=UPI003850DF7A
MYQVFESFFKFIQNLGVEGFTGYYLAFQFILFLGMIAFTAIKIAKEIRIMRRLKPKLEGINPSTIDREKASNVDQELQDAFTILPKSKYKQQWDRYFRRSSQKGEDERIRVEPFFSFDVLMHHLGYRSILESGAGTSVSLGVLGTFIGLSVGLADLNVGDTDALRTGIDGLLSGMKVAFYTSVFGVLLSLLWTFYDKGISSRLESHIDWHAEKLDFLLNTDDEELFLNRLEKISRNQADHLKTLLTDALEKVMHPVMNQMQSSNGQVTDAFNNLSEQFNGFQSGIENQTKLLETQFQYTQQNSNDMTNHLVDQITGGTEQSINQFSTLISETQQMQQEMMGTINKVVHNIAESEERQASTSQQTERMLSQFHSMTEELESMRSSYKDTSSFMNELGDTISSVQKLSEQQLPIQQDVMRSNQQLAEKYETISAGFESFNENIEGRHNELLNEVISFTSKMSTTYRDMTEKFNESLSTQIKTISESESLLQNVREIVSTLVPLAPELRSVMTNLDDLRGKLSETQQIQSQLLPEMIDLRKDTNTTITSALADTRMYMEKMEDQISSLQTHWSVTESSFRDTRDILDTSVKGFSENVDNGLSKTFHHLDETMTKAVNTVSNMINQYSDLQQELVEGLEDLSEQINQTNRKVIS